VQLQTYINIRRGIGVLSACGLLASVLFGWCELGVGFNRNDCVKVWQAIILCGWILAPPIWFWFEYFFLYDRLGTAKPDAEEFRHGQEQSAKIWLALVTVLLGLYFGKDFSHESSTPPDVKQQSAPAQPVSCWCSWVFK
jgi:hypothetical protein